MQTPQLNQLIRPREAASILGISLSTFWRIVRAGNLTTRKLTPRTTTVSSADLAAFINRGGAQ